MYNKILKKRMHPKKRIKKIVDTTPVRPRSQRIEHKLSGWAPPVLEETPETDSEIFKPKARNTEDVLSMTVDDHDEDSAWNDFLDNIRSHLNDESEVIHANSTESVVKEMQDLCLGTLQTHVVNKRIQSLCIHPMESKLLIAAGSVEGKLGLWDVGSELPPIQLQPHISPINCISVRSVDHNKLFTTSHDGTVRCADIQNSAFNLVYHTDENSKTKHITWHCELSEHTLLVAEGSGCVSVVDLRANVKYKPEKRIQCHPRSVRTVHVHPIQGNYFLTSSGTGECKIFDIRTKKEISTLLHGKSLTSAFFSPNGTKVLTTSNDDRLRIFDVTTLEAPKEEFKVLHDNHSGRWLSVFKSIWHPRSSDIFCIGSMQQPRRIQLYSACGVLLKEMKSEHMTTITPVLSLHPTLPVLAGGDSSGRIYVFTTQPNIDQFNLQI